MNRKDTLELKRRYTKESNSFSKMCGCYIDGNKEKVVAFSQTFGNLEDDEKSKYLEIAKKALSGTIGNNLLELSFENNSSAERQLIVGLKESELKNDDLIDSFYDHVIEHYKFIGNYLILIFYDAYDVLTKTTDNLKIDESEEVFKYILCTICPVALSKPGLGYIEDENKIASRIRDWVVGTPDTGLLFPAFTDRSSDTDSLMFYTKDAKTPHNELITGCFGCVPKKTAAEHKTAFAEVIKSVYEEPETAHDTFIQLQKNMDDVVREQGETYTPVTLSEDMIEELIEESHIDKPHAAELKAKFNEQFKDEKPYLDQVIDTKAVKEGEIRIIQKELVEEIASLKKQTSKSDGTYRIITLCGSTRFKDEFLEAQKRLTLDGNIVLSVGLFGHSGDDEVWDDMPEDTASQTKKMLDDMHKKKIDMSDAIYVINVGGYIGESTASEIEYAKSKGLNIMYFEEV